MFGNKILTWAGLCVAAALLGACAHRQQDNKQWLSAHGSVWGTDFHVTYKAGEDLTDSIMEYTYRVGESLSMFSPNSTVSRINSGVTDSVDSHFEKVFDISKAVARASGGVFDPTVAPLVDAWGFGRKGRSLENVPDSSEVNQLLQRVGISNTHIYNGRIAKSHPAMEFDFSAIAKGYGVEQVAEMLKRNGCSDFMVEIGGEVQLSGQNPAGKDWRIQIDAPKLDSNPGDSAATIIELTDCAIATSGNYRNYHRISGDSIIGHTINPRTGYPAPLRVLSATVIAPGCALADALATALMVVSPDSAKIILDEFPSTRAILVMPSGKVVEL